MAVVLLRDNPAKCVIGGKKVKSLQILVNRLKRSRTRRTHRWWVCQVRSNQERQLAHALTSKQRTYYLPMQRTEVRSGRKLHHGIKLALPGFLFLYGPFDAKYDAIDSDKVWNFIDVDDAALLERDLVRLDGLLKMARLDKFGAFEKGQRVMIMSGVFQGVEATVLDLQPSTMRVAVDVHMLGAAQFTIDYAKLRILKNEAKPQGKLQRPHDATNPRRSKKVQAA